MIVLVDDQWLFVVVCQCVECDYVVCGKCCVDFVEWCFVMLCECSKCDVYVVIGGCVVCCECGVCCLVC